MPWSFVSSMPVGEAIVAVRLPVEPRACPAMQLSPQPCSSKVKLGGAMTTSSRTTALPWSMLSVTSMMARGGVRSHTTPSVIFSTGLKPLVSPSFVFVGYSSPTLVSKRQLFVPGWGMTHMMTV